MTFEVSSQLSFQNKTTFINAETHGLTQRQFFVKFKLNEKNIIKSGTLIKKGKIS